MSVPIANSTFVLYCVVVHGVVLHCVVLHCVVLHCVVLHCTVWAVQHAVHSDPCTYCIRRIIIINHIIPYVILCQHSHTDSDYEVTGCPTVPTQCPFLPLAINNVNINAGHFYNTPPIQTKVPAQGYFAKHTRWHKTHTHTHAPTHTVTVATKCLAMPTQCPSIPTPCHFTYIGYDGVSDCHYRLSISIPSACNYTLHLLHRLWSVRTYHQHNLHSDLLQWCFHLCYKLATTKWESEAEQ